jgi:hypothetical protein
VKATRHRTDSALSVAIIGKLPTRSAGRSAHPISIYSASAQLQPRRLRIALAPVGCNDGMEEAIVRRGIRNEPFRRAHASRYNPADFHDNLPS